MGIKLPGCLGLVLVLFSGNVRSDTLFSTLKTMASLDIVSPVYTSIDDDKAFNPQLRAAEFSFFAPVDHLFEMNLVFAGHQEGGAFFFEVHEGFVSTSTLLPYSRIKVGKFFLGVGRLNQQHRHDWPFVSAPQSHESFFAEEAAADTGLEYSFLFPFSHFLSLTAGVTRNYCYGHCHGDGKKPPRPLYYVRPATFFEFSTESGLKLGLNYLNRENNAGVTTQLAGLDVVAKWREGKRLKYLLQFEGYYEHQNAQSLSPVKNIGAYLYSQYGLNPFWLVGLRLDAFSELSKKFQTTGERREDFDYALVPVVTWKPSEFSTLRLSYTYDVDTTQGSSDSKSHLVEAQFTFLIGEHPAHDF